MATPLPRLCLLLLPLLAACRNEPAPDPAAATTAEGKDRRELIRQPGPGWKPGNTARKLNILLLLDKTKIRKGETFLYRLEMQNVGRDPLSFKETAPSFTKDGSLCGSDGFKFYATPPASEERLLPCVAGKAEESELDLTLLPGEYLLTRGSAPGNRFRELKTKLPFETLGTYRLKAVYTPAGGLRADSNTVTLEVVP